MLDTNTKAKLWEHGKDIYDIDCIANDIIAYTGQGEQDVWKRLSLELDQSGTNVVAEAAKYGVTPHVFDEHLIKFYQESDGFIYETCVESRNPFRLLKWLAIAEFLKQSAPNPQSCNVLLYGDSVGNDSIYLKRMGFNVFYHDYDGYCSRFAKERFRKRGLKIESFTPGASQKFDYVICFEVAEHAPDPPALVAELAQLTAQNGFCIFSESFALVQPPWPTHLASNLRYVGKSDELFRREGMYVAWRDASDKPIVYSRRPVPLRKNIRRFLGKVRRSLHKLIG